VHLETACRRGGALGLRLADLDQDSCAVRLRGEGGINPGRREPEPGLLIVPLFLRTAETGGQRGTVDLVAGSVRSPIG
jgi:integrase/recombinase XerC